MDYGAAAHCGVRPIPASPSRACSATSPIFAVLVLFQKDDPFGPPAVLISSGWRSHRPRARLRHHVQGIQAWESLKSAWTDWNTLDYSINGVGHTDVKWIGTPGITITCNTTGRCGGGIGHLHAQSNQRAGCDKVTLWYQNQSFISPAIIPGNPDHRPGSCGGRDR